VVALAVGQRLVRVVPAHVSAQWEGGSRKS
jgi:hypothetical protein